MTSFLEAALKYREKGYSIIPVNPSVEEDKGKKPLVRWEEFQARIASGDEIKTWWTKFPKAMIGVVCGKISNLISLDADTPEAVEKMEELLPDSLLVPTVQTPRGGRHYDFQYSNGVRNSNNGLLHTRGEGGFIIVPPSCRSDGKAYTWTVEADPPILPVILLKYLKELQGLYVWSSEKEKDNPYNSLHSLQFLTLGSRDDDLFHTANCLFKGNMQEEKIRKVIEILAQSCNPPFDLKEAEIKIQSVIERGKRKRPKFI